MRSIGLGVSNASVISAYLTVALFAVALIALCYKYDQKFQRQERAAQAKQRLVFLLDPHDHVVGSYTSVGPIDQSSGVTHLVTLSGQIIVWPGGVVIIDPEDMNK